MHYAKHSSLEAILYMPPLSVELLWSVCAFELNDF